MQLLERLCWRLLRWAANAMRLLGRLMRWLMRVADAMRLLGRLWSRLIRATVAMAGAAGAIACAC